MASDPADRPVAPPSATGAAGEVDFREHVIAFAAWWREIVLLATLAAAAVAGLGSAVGRSWQAAATVIVVPHRAEPGVDRVFMTQDSSEALFERQPEALRELVFSGSWSGVEAEITPSRREALKELVLSGSLAQAVIDDLGDQLNEDERNPAWLLGHAVSTSPERSYLQPSDLILIAAKADDPKKAAAIANAWAKAYVREVNRLYASLPDETLAHILQKVLETQGDYDAAQLKVENFIAESEATEIEREILHHNILLESRTEMLSEYQRRRLHLELMLTDARSLRTQAEAGGHIGNAQSILLLKIEAFNSLPATLDFAIDSVTDTAGTGAAHHVDDLDALVQVLQEQLIQTDRTIEHLFDKDARYPAAANQSASSWLDTPGEVERALQRLKKRKEAVAAEHRLLLAERDRHWDALRSLRAAQAGLELASSATVPQARLASAAVPPAGPIWSTRMLAIIGGALGLSAGIVLALAGNFLGLGPFLGKRA